VTPATGVKLPYDTVQDLAAVGLLVRDPFLFIVGDQVRQRRSPNSSRWPIATGQAELSTPGTASQSHFVTELFDERAGIKMTEIPYRGGAPAMLALMSGEAQFAVLSTQLSSPQIAGGKVRALASGGRLRDAHFPNVPTLAESGFPGLEALQWVGMLAPQDTEGHHREAERRTGQNPGAARRDQPFHTAQGVTAASSSSEEFQTLIETEVKQWLEVSQKKGRRHPRNRLVEKPLGRISLRIAERRRAGDHVGEQAPGRRPQRQAPMGVADGKPQSVMTGARPITGR